MLLKMPFGHSSSQTRVGSPLADYCSQLSRLLERRAALAEANRATADRTVALRSRSEFLANMSHELRTPLNAIIGFSEMIASRPSTPADVQRYASYAEDIHQSGVRLLEVINDILDLSDIEARNLALTEDLIDPAAVISNCVTIARKRAQAARVELILWLPATLPMLCADKRLFMQAVSNILSNAVKFTPADGRVTIRSGVGDHGGLEVTIADNGIGIAPHDIGRALAPFTQVDGGLNRRFDGSGLGLPLAKAYVELHGGALRLDSRVGGGTTVTISLPPERNRERGER
jgi:signal transduction histidine kinase